MKSNHSRNYSNFINDVRGYFFTVTRILAAPVAMMGVIPGYPDISREDAEKFARSLPERFRRLADAILQYAEGKDDLALSALIRISESSLSVDERGMAALFAAKILYDRILSELAGTEPKSLRDMAGALKKLNTVRELLSKVKGRPKEDADKLVENLYTLLMRKGIEAFDRGNKVLAALFFNEALKIAELGSDLVRGKAYYNYAVLLLKIGKKREAEKVAGEALIAFKKSGVSDDWVKKAEQLLESIRSS